MSPGPLGVEIRVGRVVHAELFPQTRKPGMMKLRIDIGDREVASAAQYAPHYTPDELVGRLVLCATGLGVVKIAGFASEVLTVGVAGHDDMPVLVVPDKDVPLGGHLH